MNWPGIRGHEFPLRFLERALASGRIGHAYLFVGRAQIGKATVARLFLQALYCEAPRSAAPCGECRACRRVARGSHPDVHWIEPDGEAVRIEQIRELQNVLSLKPFEAERKAAVIDGADRMTVPAQNCLLKVLEEPPGETVIILIAANPAALLPTIWSRCQVLRFYPLPLEETVAALRERGVEERQARLLASLTEGCLGAALASLEKDVVGMRDRVAGWVEALADRHTGRRAVLEIGQALEEARDQLEEVLSLFLLWLRDMVLVREGVAGPLANQDAEGRLRAGAGAMDVRAIAGAMRAVDEARRRLQANANFRLTLDVMLAKVQRSLAS